MAFTPTNAENWIREDADSNVIKTITQTSVIERIAKHYTMTTDSLLIPRAGEVEMQGVAKGGLYEQQTLPNDLETLVAQKFGGVFPINLEDQTDTWISVMDQIQERWARSYALTLDNACLGVDGDADAPDRLFVSAYRSLTTSNPKTGYVADDNVIDATGSDVTYEQVSELLAKLETSNFYDPTSTRIIAHPAAKQALRNIRDDEGRPIFVYGQSADGGTPTRLFNDMEVEFSLGARVSPGMTHNPQGSYLMYVVNTDYLALGVRSGPETAFASADSGPGFMSDQDLIKMRARRAFRLLQEQAAAVLVFGAS